MSPSQSVMVTNSTAGVLHSPPQPVEKDKRAEMSLVDTGDAEGIQKKKYSQNCIKQSSLGRESKKQFLLNVGSHLIISSSNPYLQGWSLIGIAGDICLSVHSHNKVDRWLKFKNFCHLHK